MKKLIWKNSTAMHPNGVCEAATVLWLQRIYNVNVADANKLLPTDCDILQARVEKGDTLILPETFRSYVGEDVSFDPFNAQIILKKSKIEDPIANEEFVKLLSILNPGEFWYINATMPDNIQLGGHALAVYKDDDLLYFFDPNTGIYEVEMMKNELSELADTIISTTIFWKDIVALPGKLNNK